MRRFSTVFVFFFIFLFISVSQAAAVGGVPPGGDPPAPLPGDPVQIPGDCPPDAPAGTTCKGLTTKECTNSGCEVYICEQKNGNLFCDSPQPSSTLCPPLSKCLYSQACVVGADDPNCKVYTCGSSEDIKKWFNTEYICVIPRGPDPTAEPTEPPSPRLPCSSGWDENNQLTTDRESITSCHSIETGLGISIGTDQQSLIKDLFGVILGISGGIALILIIYSGYQLISSQGKPESLEAAREQLTAAIIGLLFIIFSLVLLQFIGFNILRIPGIGP